MKTTFLFVSLLAVGGTASAQSWSLTGNAGTNANNNFIGTTDNKPLNFRTNNQASGFMNGTHTAMGKLSLSSNSSGTENTAFGAFALRYNTTGSANAAFGKNALTNNTEGAYNTAAGRQALLKNTTGSYNTAIGANAMEDNTTGRYNTGLGRYALGSNTTGTNNTAVGYSSQYYNTIGTENVGVGYQANYYNVAGSGTVAIGTRAMLYSNNSSTAFTTENTAVGFEALRGSVTAADNTGIRNTALGYQALDANTSGSFNTALGVGALGLNTTGSYLCGLGRAALDNNTTGDNNSGFGYGADVSVGTLTNATALGYSASVTASNKVRLGNASVNDVEGQVAYSWPSDARFKRDVEEDVPGLDLIEKLRPVSYTFDRLAFARHTKEDLEGREAELTQASQARTVGFLAQEVEATVKELGYAAFDAVRTPDNETDNYSLAYAEFVVPLVKAVQELAAKNSALEERNSALEERLTALEQRTGSDTGAEEMKAYPVPADELVRIEPPARWSGLGATLELRDVQGRTVDMVQMASLSSVVELPLDAALKAGSYTVVLRVAGEQPATARIVIAR